MAKIFKRLFTILLTLIITFVSFPISTFAASNSLNSIAQNIANKYSNVTKIVYGKSQEGYDLEAYLIKGTGNNSKTIMCDFEVHGFEDSYAKDGKVLVQCANETIEYYAKNSYLLKDCQLIVIPSANPDGAMHGNNNLRTGSTAFGRCTKNHVDINRDFYSGGFKCQESRALRDLIIKYKDSLYFYLDCHGWLDETLGDATIHNAFASANSLSKYINSYGSQSGYIIGWVKSTLGKRSSLIEFESPKNCKSSNFVKGLNNAIASLPNQSASISSSNSKVTIGKYGQTSKDITITYKGYFNNTKVSVDNDNCTVTKLSGTGSTYKYRVTSKKIGASNITFSEYDPTGKLLKSLTIPVEIKGVDIYSKEKNISANISNDNPTVFQFGVDGILPTNYYIDFDCDTNCALVSKGSEKSTGINIVVVGQEVGTTNCTATLVDKDTGEKLSTTSFTVDVAGPEYEISYDSAPSSSKIENDIKLYNIDKEISEEIPSGKQYKIVLNDPLLGSSSTTYIGEKFTEWNDGNNTYLPGEKYTYNGDATLRAVYTDAVFSTSEPSNDGYVFLGWYDSLDLDSNNKPLGNKYISGETVLTDDVVLYAMWSVNGSEDAVSFSKDGQHIHNYIETNTIDATCSSNGIITYSCDGCEKTKTEITPMVDHNYDSNNIGSSYGEKGRTKYECTLCENAYSNNYQNRLSLPFDDINMDSQYYSMVGYCYDNGLIKGTSSTTFSPNKSINRAMIITIIYRMNGSVYDDDNPYETSPFSDVTDTSVYYYNAACWALDNGITTETKLNPLVNVTREQTATFIYRYATNILDADTTMTNDISNYPDYSDVSSWAVTPLSWANANFIITGTQQGYLNPKGTTLRVHTTKMLYNFGIRYF